MSIYLRVLSLTDHAIPLQGRHQGPYRGMNDVLHTSEVSAAGALRVSANTQMRTGRVDRNQLNDVQVLVAYRHTDTGVLQGTSELLIPIAKLPWKEIPGFEIPRAESDGSLHLVLWNQELALPPNQLIRIQSGKTLVFLKSTSVSDEIEWTEDRLLQGPLALHADRIDQDLTLAPAGGSGIQIRAGQETTD